MANEYGAEPRLPAIPDLNTADVKDAVRVMKEWIEVRQGARGSELDRAVTMRDLLNTGLATSLQLSPVFHGPDPIPLIPGVESPAIPPTPTDLSAAGAVSTIILTWEFARGYSRLSHFEVWRSETDALGDALMIAQTAGTSYADAAGSGATFYYWVRAVSDAGTSPFNAVEGTKGETALSVEEVFDAINEEINDSGLLEQLTVKVDYSGYVSGYGLASTPSTGVPSTTFAVLANRFLVTGPAEDGVLPSSPFFIQTTPTTLNGVAVPKGVYMTSAYIQNGVITNAKIGNLAVDNAKIASVSVDKLTAGSLGVSAFIESTNYQSGSTGFRINGNGNAEFSNATVRGTVLATAGSIGGNTINSTGIQSPGYNGVSGWRLSSDGSAMLGSDVLIRGALLGATGTFAGSLSAADGTFAGRLVAATGTFHGNGTFGGTLSAADGSFSGTLTAAAVNAVNTLNVAGNAITGMTVATGGANSVPSGGSNTILLGSVTMPANASGVAVMATVSMNAPSSASMTISILRNGVASIGAVGVSMQAGFATLFTFTALDTAPSTGTTTYYLHLQNPSAGPGSNVPVSVSSSSMAISGAKR